MKLQLFQYECKNCGHNFKSPQLIGNPYGEFLMRNEKGDILYLNSFSDPIFDEVEGLFKESKIKIRLIKQEDRINLFQKLFSISCDPDIDGSLYGIGQKPKCPYCGQVKIGHWGPTNPSEYVDIDIKPVTHNAWNQLSKKEKKERIDTAIDQYLNNANK